MSGSTPTGFPPPEVPEEFADVYRAAYERSLAAQTGGLRDGGGDPAADVEHLDEVENRDDETVSEGWSRTASRDSDYDERQTWFDSARASAWFVPVLLVVLLAVLIIGAYLIGRAFSDQVGKDGAASSAPAVVATAWRQGVAV